MKQLEHFNPKSTVTVCVCKRRQKVIQSHRRKTMGSQPGERTMWKNSFLAESPRNVSETSKCKKRWKERKQKLAVHVPHFQNSVVSIQAISTECVFVLGRLPYNKEMTEQRQGPKQRRVHYGGRHKRTNAAEWSVVSQPWLRLRASGNPMCT